MKVDTVVWACLMVGVSFVSHHFGYSSGVLEGGKFVIKQLMHKGAVTVIHTDGNSKVIWEVDVPDERLTEDER